ncbi:TPA: metal-dependent hydrolase [Campylobacter coli]|uniref:Metal-dependent hydrolase n=1 Tax=Campylobacter coli TaxID=195 RepID=A0A695DPK7_CAMCO|nr:metal-dependent hydrolase [Campylobacter coli]EAH7177470.1 metal-dependent hydrolase [Campylobacter coli]EAH7506184.1 metal-dependent hydrolase [Campylobacter coli]EAH9208096.1 metal-dependent hydrolase [Campylobacter coli]EAI5973157.1 metal-dependent hydrolase [Campylobacter coli]EAI9460472.1 metal-dependent hydrolase [Campylobacter coli]
MLIKNAKIYGENLQDLLIKDAKIVKIGTNLDDDEVLDAQGMTLLPSFVDLCVNLKNDKFSLNNLELLEKECLRGGVGAIMLRDCMDFDEESFSLFLQNLKSRKVQIFPSVCALDKQGKLKNLATLLNKGAYALELKSSSNANILRVGMQYALMKEKSLFVKCYDENFDDNGVMNDCEMSFELGLAGMSAVAESSEVAKIKEIAKFYGVKVIFDLLSLKRSMELLGDENLKLISIHHLIKDDSACAGFNTAAKLNPPLRSKEDKESLKQALKQGKIDFLSSLHSAKSISLKDLAFDEAAFGIHSICEFMSLCYTFLIKERLLTWQNLCKVTSQNPSEFLGLNSGIIEVGKEANLVLFDENEEISAPKSSLYANDKLFGKVKLHLVKGEKIILN